MHRYFNRPTTEQTLLDDAIKKARDWEAKTKDDRKPFSNIEIYYICYLAVNKNGKLAKADIFLRAVKACMDKGETFSPEFCEKRPEARDFNPSEKIQSSWCPIL